MPTYEYACTSCRRRFDVVQSFSDDPLTTCEECGGTLKRVFHPVGVVLKGSGFYATDNRSTKSLAPKSDSSKAEPSSGSKGDTKGKSGGDAKPSSSEGGSGKPSGGSSGGSKPDA